VISHEPAIQFALELDMRMQVRVSVETRTTAYHVRTNEYPEEQLSVYVAAKRYGGIQQEESYTAVMDKLASVAKEIVDNHVVDSILLPLQHAIAIR